jgi:REP element-mobilizing transposase RayT
VAALRLKLISLLANAMNSASLWKGNLTMPQFDHLPYPSRYNTLRLLGYDYTSTRKLCAITLVANSRRPLFVDMTLAKLILKALLSQNTPANIDLRAFTLMPDHLHFLGGVRQPEFTLPNLIGTFKSFTTQLYWKRSGEIIESGEISLPSKGVSKSSVEDYRPLISSLLDGRATLRPEVVQLKNWPTVQPESFLKKQLWQSRFFDHVIRNDKDLRENVNYIAMNPVKAGYVSQSCFYPYTGFLD